MTDAKRYHIYFDGDMIAVTDKSGVEVGSSDTTYSVAYSVDDQGETVATVTFYENDYQVIVVKE